MSNSEHIPRSIKVLTVARSVRWFGWGMCETLIPVLLFSFSHSYVEAGLFRSIYNIVFILSLPIVSILADKIPAKKLILFALALYPLIGLSYFVAGVLGTALFIVIARAINGVTWCCDSVGSDTYLRRFAFSDHISKSFGYLSALPNLSWMIAALISILFIPFVPITWLFLAIIPTSLIALIILRSAPADEIPVQSNIRSLGRFQNMLDVLKGIKDFKMEIWGLAYLTFFVACVDLLGTFFIPLFTYTDSNSLPRVVIISVIFAIPSAFAFWFGAFVDRVSKGKFVVWSLTAVVILLGVLSFMPGYVFQLIGIFILGILTVCISLAIQALATKASARENYGKIGGIMTGADEMGAMLGPIMIGLLIDRTSVPATFLVICVAGLLTCVGLFCYLFYRQSDRISYKYTKGA